MKEKDTRSLPDNFRYEDSLDELIFDMEDKELTKEEKKRLERYKQELKKEKSTS